MSDYREFKDPLLRLALRKFEAKDPSIAGYILRDDYPDGFAERMLESGAFSRGPLEYVVRDRHSFGQEPVDVEWDADREAYCYVAVDSGQYVAAEEADMRSYVVNRYWLVESIQQGLNVRAAPIELLEGVLWDFGEARFGKRKASIFLSRGTSRGELLEQIINRLRDRAGKPPGLILTSAFDLPKPMPIFPGGHRMVMLSDCLNPTAETIELDMPVLEGVLRGDSLNREVEPLRYSSDFSSVVVHGRTYSFRGVKQRKIVEALVRRYERGEPRSHMSEILEEAESNATSIRRAFKGADEAWKEIIGYGDRGLCWLKI
ncbi:hypothetical protein [Magnetococcus sp. PR-3]|uniref:hypothetical protein n=1 Tax=Magnetococcus sp. PR-3 TaxID=3120355 RepID=UPI002FCE472E